MGESFLRWRRNLSIPFVKGADKPKREPPETPIVRQASVDEEYRLLDLLMQNIVLEAQVGKLTDQIACVERYITYRNDVENLGKEALSFDEWYKKHASPKRRA